MGYEWDGKHFCLLSNGNFRNKRTGVLLTPRRMCQYMDYIHDWTTREEKLLLYEENEWRKQYQRTLEDKIRRLKNRIQVLEK